MNYCFFNYICVYVSNLERSKQFYEYLGLIFTEEKHNEGPVHFSTVISMQDMDSSNENNSKSTEGLTFEIYKRKTALDMNSNSIRFGFNVNDCSKVEKSIINSEFKDLIKKGEKNLRKNLIINDPDGNTIELIECKAK